MPRKLSTRAAAPLFVVLLLLAPRSVAQSPAETRAAFLKVIDRPRVDLAAKEQPPQVTEQDLRQVAFTFASEAAERVPGILLKRPGDGPRPVVIVCHGTGGSKQGELPYLRKLAARGFVAVAIDGRYHGERGNSDTYNAAIARAFANAGKAGGEHPLYYDTVWDLMRLVDYLASRPDVDPKRIGLMGISKGGIETYFAGAVDERIAVVVPCIGVQSFAFALENNLWQGRVGTVKKGFTAAANGAGVPRPDAAFVRTFYDRVVPGIYGEFDCPVMLTLVAPRPLLIVNGDKDDKTPLAGVILAATAARQAYADVNAADHFKQIVEPNTGHQVTAESFNAVLAWFERWLKPEGK